jgi:hypothetical protein
MGFFNIEEYETAATRIDKFWKQYGIERGRIETDLLAHENGHYIVKAKIYIDNNQVATGLADEHTEQKGVNARNALENAETSAIARALANLNYQPKSLDGKPISELRPSREEMVKANVVESLGATEIEKTSAPLKFRTRESVKNDFYDLAKDKRATPKQIGYLLSILDTHLGGPHKRTDDKTGHNAFVRFALSNPDKRIVPDSNLTFGDVRPLFDDHKAGQLGDNISAWLTGLPESHQTAEIIAAGGLEDDPWTSPGF